MPGPWSASCPSARGQDVRHSRRALDTLVTQCLQARGVRRTARYRRLARRERPLASSDPGPLYEP
jgi:hypothetical protein